MSVTGSRPWPRDVAEAGERQRALAARVELDGPPHAPRLVAGVDVGPGERENSLRGAAVLLRLPELDVVESAVAEVPEPFPYIPGYLSFREVPPVLAALARLRQTPEMLICDGQGIAHPRRFGLACHLGVVTGLPALGLAKRRLCGQFSEPCAQRGCRSPLMADGEQIGWVLRTRDGVKPLFVSPGHLVSMDAACDLALAVTPRFRISEPVRRAHALASPRP